MSDPCERARLFFEGHDLDLGPELYSGRGSELVEEFYKEHGSSGSYYPHFEESRLIRENALAISKDLRDTHTLRIVGPGPVSHEGMGVSLAEKEMHIITYLMINNLKQVDVIDVSPTIAEENAGFLRDHFTATGLPQAKHIKVNPIVADYRDAPPSDQPNTTVISVGSLLSNPSGVEDHAFPDRQISDSLAAFRRLAGPHPGGKVMLGVDGCQNPDLIAESYNSPVFRSWIINGVSQLIQACPHVHGFDPARAEDILDYVGEWHKPASTWRHKVRFREDLPVGVGHALRNQFGIVAGETRNVLNSVKIPDSKPLTLGQNAGLDRFALYQGRIGVSEHLFHVVPLPNGP